MRPWQQIPKVVRLFAIVYSTFAAFALINNLVRIDGFHAQLSASFGSEVPIAIAYVGFFFRFAFRLVLTWLIVRKASVLARWFVFVWGLTWLKDVPGGFVALTSGNGFWVPWLAIISLQLFAVVCLFTPRANLWFKDKGEITEDISAKFD